MLAAGVPRPQDTQQAAWIGTGATSSQRLPSPTQNPTDTMQTQTPQPNNPSPPHNPPPREACPPMADHSRVVGSKMRQGVNPSPFLKQSKPCLNLQNNQKPTSPRHANSPEIPSRHNSIKTATNSINVQSSSIKINQSSINLNHPSIDHLSNRPAILCPSPHSAQPTTLHIRINRLIRRPVVDQFPVPQNQHSLPVPLGHVQVVGHQYHAFAILG